LLRYTKFGPQINQHAAGSIQNLALDGTNAVKFNRGFQIQTHRGQVIVIQRALQRLQLGGAEFADILNTVGQQGAALDQVSAFKAQALTLARTEDRCRCPASNARHELQRIVFKFNAGFCGGNTFLFK
jgi:hypothetical protein